MYEENGSSLGLRLLLFSSVDFWLERILGLQKYKVFTLIQVTCILYLCDQPGLIIHMAVTAIETFYSINHYLKLYYLLVFLLILVFPGERNFDFPFHCWVLRGECLAHGKCSINICM